MERIIFKGEIMKMPFGKYKGLDLEEIPLEYIDWLINLDNLHGQLKEEVEHIYKTYCDPSFKGVISASKIKSVYREMAFKHHPDRGGSTDSMRVVIDFYERLKST